jgi:hypothetical protein
MSWQPDYTTLSECKSFMGGISGAQDDAALAAAISAASRAIDDYCGRQFGQAAAPVARYYDAVSSYTFAVDDLMDTDDVTVSTDLAGDQSYSTAVDDFRFYPLNAPADGVPYTQMRLGDGVTYGPVVVTARWGWLAVPAEIKYATLIQSSRIFKRKDAPFGILGSPEMGSELRLLAKLDPDVHVLLTGKRRLWGSV